MANLKAYILNRFAYSNNNYTSWMPDCPYPCEIVQSFAPDWQVPDDAGIIITHLHYRWEEVALLRRIYETTRVPILILADGILEYSNTWENPGIADGAVFQPLTGHKLACIGRAQARIVESWGNYGKCEVVGLPKLDSLLNSEYLPVEREGPFRLLVASANTPAFTPEQRTSVVDSLIQLKQRLENNPFVNQRPIEVTWRLTDGLDSAAGIDPASESIPISDAIELADGVITTPSTIYLESVVKRRPTAILDYGNRPTFVPSAWSITAPVHMNQVLSELENPPAAKMQFQRTVLQDQLESGSPATKRLYALIQAMFQVGQQARQSGQALQFPDRICPVGSSTSQINEPEFDQASLHPNNPVFQVTNVERLQLELNQAIARLGQLPKELDEKDANLLRKNAHITCMQRQLEKAEIRVRQTRARVVEKQQKLNEAMQLMKERSQVIAKKEAHIEAMAALYHEANQKIKNLRAQLDSKTTNSPHATKSVATNSVAAKSVATKSVAAKPNVNLPAKNVA